MVCRTMRTSTHRRAKSHHHLCMVKWRIGVMWEKWNGVSCSHGVGKVEGWMDTLPPVLDSSDGEFVSCWVP